MPVLLTPRLRLRPFQLEDGPRVRLLAGAREVAATTLRMPHPYPEGAAEAWILTHPGAWERGEEVNLAVVRLEDDLLVGAIGLRLFLEDERVEMGYWIGVPYWNQGYATEAARALSAWAFAALGVQRVHACHFAGNEASGAVMRKIGMSLEGRQRRQIVKWGEGRDLVLYGMLREEYVGA